MHERYAVVAVGAVPSLSERMDGSTRAGCCRKSCRTQRELKMTINRREYTQQQKGRQVPNQTNRKKAYAFNMTIVHSEINVACYFHDFTIKFSKF